MGQFSCPQSPLGAGEVSRGDRRGRGGPAGTGAAAVYSSQWKKDFTALINPAPAAALLTGSSLSVPFTWPLEGGLGAPRWVCRPAVRLLPQASQPLPPCGCGGWAAGELAPFCLLPALLTALSSSGGVPTHLLSSPSPGAATSLPVASHLPAPPPLRAHAPSCPERGQGAGCPEVMTGGVEPKPTGGPVAGGVPVGCQGCCAESERQRCCGQREQGKRRFHPPLPRPPGRPRGPGGRENRSHPTRENSAQVG